MSGEYMLYANEGFALMENIAANAVLRKSTNNKQAMIATVTMPFKYDAID